jgi:hypothetical protein
VSYLSLETVFDKWINAKFEGKMVVSVTKKDQFTNLRLSLINGRSYTTKLGDAMSVQLAPNDLQDLIETLNEIQQQYFLRSQNG